jgi:hypothetical protein
LRLCPDNSDRVILGAAAAQCGRAATASITSKDLLQELRGVVPTLLSGPSRLGARRGLQYRGGLLCSW